jgi:hypothetical protein
MCLANVLPKRGFALARRSLKDDQREALLYSRVEKKGSATQLFVVFSSADLMLDPLKKRIPAIALETPGRDWHVYEQPEEPVLEVNLLKPNRLILIILGTYESLQGTRSSFPML